jgi:4-amino-4-deoxy-L-arabinose transferase-like glycosyltransferase
VNTRQLRSHWLFLLVLVVMLPFLFVRLAQVPYTWYDEGLNLSALSTLAETGLYALSSDGQLRLADPAIQTGPPMIVPMSWYYRLSGHDLALIRLPVVITSLITLVVFYAFVCRLFNRNAALLAVLFLLAMPGEYTGSYILLSRQVLGEIPAILVITLGLHLLLNERSSLLQNILTGLLFGLAIALKSQVLLILPAALGLWALYRIYRDRQEWRRWLVIIGVLLLVYGLDTLWRAGMAGDQFTQNTNVLRDGALIHILPFRALNNLRDTSLLLRFGAMLLAVGGTILLLWRVPAARPTRPQNRQVMYFLLLFVSVWALWYALVSIGWQRYAFIGLVFAMPFLGFLAAYLIETVVRRPAVLRWVYVGATVVLLAFIAYYQWRKLQDTGGEQFFAMTDFVQQNVPQDAVIVSWEWPAQFVTGRQVVYPTTNIVNAITADLALGHGYDPALFNPLAECPSYVLLGSFEVDRRVLAEALAAAEPEPLFSQGYYELYHIPEGNLERRPDGTCSPASSSARSK